MNSSLPDLYEQMRQSILQTATDNLSRSPFESAYVFAWHAGVYPALNKEVDCHQAYKQQFEVNGEKLCKLQSFLGRYWRNQEELTFWQLEDAFEAEQLEEWDRHKLIDACRYLHMHGYFDQTFWDNLLINMPDDSITHIITKPFEERELGFAL